MPTRSEAQKLDIYLPARVDGPRPVILWIHPGGFHCGDKGGNASSPGAKFSILELVLPMLERGYSVVSTNYRLSGEAVFPAAVHDVKAAVRWIRTHASRYDFAPDKIVAWGSPPAVILPRCSPPPEGWMPWRIFRWGMPSVQPGHRGRGLVILPCGLPAHG